MVAACDWRALLSVRYVEVQGTARERKMHFTTSSLITWCISNYVWLSLGGRRAGRRMRMYTVQHYVIGRLGPSSKTIRYSIVLVPLDIYRSSPPPLPDGGAQ